MVLPGRRETSATASRESPSSLISRKENSGSLVAPSGKFIEKSYAPFFSPMVKVTFPEKNMVWTFPVQVPSPIIAVSLRSDSFAVKYMPAESGIYCIPAYYIIRIPIRAILFFMTMRANNRKNSSK